MEYARERIRGAGDRISQVDPVHSHKMQIGAHLASTVHKTSAYTLIVIFCIAYGGGRTLPIPKQVD